MVGHAAFAERLRDSVWWDWRGWSDWFYGGQAMGVNYPPLPGAWLRFTDPLHGQFVAVAIGLLVLLPWVVRSMARALRVETVPATWVVLYTIVAFAGWSHWFLSGFHSVSTGFGSWPAMIAGLLGLVCVAWAFELRRPVGAGVSAGLSGLWNSTVAPGIIILVVVVLVGVVHMDRRRAGAAVRWAATVAAVAGAVCGWWLVPFVDGWRGGRLAEWRVPLLEAATASIWQPLVVVVIVVGCVASLGGVGDRGRLLAVGVLAAALAAGAADRSGYLRAERWIVPALVVAIALCALGAPRAWARQRPTAPGLAARGPKTPEPAVGVGPASLRGVGEVGACESGLEPGTAAPTEGVSDLGDRERAESPGGDDAGVHAPRSAPGVPRGDAPTGRDHPVGAKSIGGKRVAPSGGRNVAGQLLVSAALVAVAWFAGLWVLVPGVGWVLWQRRSTLVRYAAPGWCALLLVFPASRFGALTEEPQQSPPSAAMAAAANADSADRGGLVYLQHHGSHPYGGLINCTWGDPWSPLAGGGTALRPLDGLYRETSAAAEFIHAERMLRVNEYPVYGRPINDWSAAWAQTPTIEPDSRQAAEALGASWIVTCNPDDTIEATPITPRRISGVSLAAHPGDDAWHRDATVWWAALLTNQTTLTEAEAAVPASGGVDWAAYPPSQAATGVSLLEAGESFAATAETAGWAWIRIPWDPYWHSHNGTPVLKGGPGHIVAWIDEGQNNYGWWVPRHVDIAAIATTTTAAALALTLLITGRRRSAADPWSRSPTLNCRPTAPQPAEPDRGASPAANPTRHKINDYFSKSIETVS